MTDHPLDNPAVKKYLGDLDIALLRTAPAERGEIIASVREYFVEKISALGGSASDSDIRRVVASAGSAEDMVAAWRGGESRIVVARASRESESTSAWMPILSIAIGLVCMVAFLVPFLPLVLSLANAVAAVFGYRHFRATRTGTLWIVALVVGFTSFAALVVAYLGTWLFLMPWGDPVLVDDGTITTAIPVPAPTP